METKRGSGGQFERVVEDDDVIEVLVTADRPLGTSEAAQRLDIPRTTAHDTLSRLVEEGVVETWMVHDTTRIWTVPGRWGETRVRDCYNAEPMCHYVEEGVFPAGTEIDDVLGMLEELFMEMNWKMPFNGGFKYEEVERLADLFGLDVTEFVTKSPSDLYDLLHDGAVHDIPTARDETPQRFRELRKEHGIQQMTVADKAGIVQSDVSMWERGKKDLDQGAVETLWDTLDQLTGQGGDGQ